MPPSVTSSPSVTLDELMRAIERDPHMKPWLRLLLADAIKALPTILGGLPDEPLNVLNILRAKLLVLNYYTTQKTFLNEVRLVPGTWADVQGSLEERMRFFVAVTRDVDAVLRLNGLTEISYFEKMRPYPGTEARQLFTSPRATIRHLVLRQPSMFLLPHMMDGMELRS